jgi:hypothetical protein
LKEVQLPPSMGAECNHDELASGSSRLGLGLMTGLVNQHRAALHMQCRISGGTHVHVVAVVIDAALPSVALCSARPFVSICGRRWTCMSRGNVCAGGAL